MPTVEVTDYRALNENTVKDKFPLPRIETVLDNLAASRVYSAIDYKDGYYLIRNAESAEQLCASITPFGLFEWLVMPQGVCNGPSTFQRMGNSCFQELIYTRQCLQLYLDDLMAHTATIADHFDVLQTIFRICRDRHLRLNLRKCLFFQTTLPWLGHIVDNV